MHDMAFEIGRAFFQTYVTGERPRILDAGAQNVNGTLRDCAPEGAEYVGVDLAPGPGVERASAATQDMLLFDEATDALKACRAELAAARADYELRLAKIAGSTSWRITAPIRAATRAARAAGRRLRG